MIRATLRVRFVQVGRRKLTWEEDVPLAAAGVPCPDALERAVRRKRALMSSDVECTDRGAILAGFHSVGRWELVEVAP